MFPKVVLPGGDGEGGALATIPQYLDDYQYTQAQPQNFYGMTQVTPRNPYRKTQFTAQNEHGTIPAPPMGSEGDAGLSGQLPNAWREEQRHGMRAQRGDFDPGRIV